MAKWYASSSANSPARSPAVRSSHAATFECASPRSRRGSDSYATSRVRTCLKMYSRWPDNVEPARDETSSRSSNRRKASPASDPETPVSSVIGPVQKTRPTTEAACSSRLSPASRRSMREARTACTVSGMSTSSIPEVALQRSPSRRRRPPSISRRTISSRKNGFPSARSRILRWTDEGRSSTVSSSRTSRSASSLERGSRASEDMFLRPPPQLGRFAVRSGRDGHRKSTGPSLCSASSSSRSSNTGSAQWMSSITTVTGPERERAVKNERHAAWSSSRTSRGPASAKDTSGSSSPTVYARAAVDRAGSVATSWVRRSRPVFRTFSTASSGGSESRIPA